MGKSKNNGTNFLVQGSILAVASIISRIIGLVYRIPLNNILGDVGISYYACAFDVYNVILIISSYSLPQAVSKTVSAKAAKGQYRSVYQVLKGALLFALVSGIVASLVVFFGAEFFTGQKTQCIPHFKMCIDLRCMYRYGRRTDPFVWC